MVETAAPLLSVTIPTRGRAERLRAGVESILACEGPSFELIVVDQSDDRASEEALRTLLGQAPLRYVRSETRGMCAARNVGIGLSRGEILVCTDDDCLAPPVWLARIAEVFAADPGLAVLFGKVEVDPEVFSHGGFVAYFGAEEPVLTRASLRRGACGISANMSLRRKVAEELQGFDEALGAGSVLGSASETDLTWRALSLGYRVRAEPACANRHYGARFGPTATQLLQRYFFGAGACYAKHTRAGDLAALGVLFAYSGRFLGDMIRGLWRGRPVGLKSLVALWRGAAASFRYRVARGPRLYVERGSGARVRGLSGQAALTGLASRALS